MASPNAKPQHSHQQQTQRPRFHRGDLIRGKAIRERSQKGHDVIHIRCREAEIPRLIVIHGAGKFRRRPAAQALSLVRGGEWADADWLYVEGVIKIHDLS